MKRKIKNKKEKCWNMKRTDVKIVMFILVGACGNYVDVIHILIFFSSMMVCKFNLNMEMNIKTNIHVFLSFLRKCFYLTK